ncbi:hypothetical protein [Chroococcidiopsis sp.]|uniref:hypothetical protein n=1 Tax=Chroococcidiopsis sp. TaxID=3088168 RepID=UPI003F3758EF
MGNAWLFGVNGKTFLPTIMAVTAIALAFTMLSPDRAGDYGLLEQWGWIYAGGANGVREVLSSELRTTVNSYTFLNFLGLTKREITSELTSF